MTGCLQKGTAPNSYMLDNVEGNGPKTIGLVSSASNLAPHVGHKIEVSSPGESHPEALSEPYLNVSAHIPLLNATTRFPLGSTTGSEP